MKETEERCCFCLCASNISFTKLDTKNCDGLTHFHKICSSLRELGKILNDHSNYDFKLCGQCSDTIEMVYQFNQACLMNIAIFLSDSGFVQIKTDIDKCNPISMPIVNQPETTNKTVVVKTEPFLDPEEYDNFTNIDEEIIVKQEMEDPLSFSDIRQDGVGITGSNHTYKNFENILVQSTEEESIKVEENQDLIEDPLREVAEEKVNQAQGSFKELHAKKKKNLKCDICGKLCKQKSHLTTHILVHTGEKPHVCEICGKSFKQKPTLKLHMVIHTGEKPHKCDICGKLFNHKSNLKKHLLRHISEESRKCDICGKIFKQKSHLKKHMLAHAGEKPYQCDFCEKLFDRKSHLRTHTLVHTGEKPHKCDICGKSFNQTSNLNIHMLTHTGEKQHKCDICGKLFSQKSNLKTHMLTHTGEKQHKCDICNKLFNQANHLKLHLLIHTGEKDHKCDICGKLFNRKDQLKRHFLIHTSKKPH